MALRDRQTGWLGSLGWKAAFLAGIRGQSLRRSPVRALLLAGTARLNLDIHTPAISTVHRVLDRHGLVKRSARRRNEATGRPLSTSDQPNDLWYADYKGEF
jgi:signal transduction protein with GAF and PtsI domain